jgi:tetratricopeptide (TPR) repeat protein
VLILAEQFHDEILSEPNVRRINGLRHELIAALTRFRDWSVREAGARLNEASLVGRKAYDITANAVEEEGEIFVSFMLRRHSDGEYIWSQRASIALDNWQSAKLKLIRSIATSLDVQISAERLSRIANVPDQNLDVYDRWLRGNELTYGWRPEEETRAEAIFRSIIAEAPDFAPAYAGLVQILNTRHHIFPGVMRDKAREQEAIALARTAAKLDPMDTRTQLCLAWSQLLHENFDQAVFYYDLALQMNENDPWTLTSCAQGLSYCGEKERAHLLADRALEVASGGEPIHWSYQMCIRFLEGDHEGALRAAGRAEGTAFFVDAWKAASRAILGQADPARAAIAAFYGIVAGNWHGAAPVTPQAVLDWFMQCFPIRDPADREKLRAGVLAAGLLELRG